MQVQCVIYTVQCSGCSVLPAKDEDLAVETGLGNNFFLMYRMSAKSTFLGIDMKSLCKHIPRVWERHLFFFYSKVHKIGQKEGLCIFKQNSQIGTSSKIF